MVARFLFPLCSSPEIGTEKEKCKLYSAGPVDAEISPGGQATHSWVGGRRAQVHTHAHTPWKSRTKYVRHPHLLSDLEFLCLPLPTGADSALIAKQLGRNVVCGNKSESEKMSVCSRVSYKFSLTCAVLGYFVPLIRLV